MQLPKEGTRVRIVPALGATSEGWFVNEKHLHARRPNAPGIYKGVVPGTGGDIWWVKHDDGATGAYLAEEVIVEPAPSTKHNISKEDVTVTESASSLTPLGKMKLLLDTGVPYIKVERHILDEAIRQAVADEREACARIAKKHWKDCPNACGDAGAKAIRERK